MADATATPGDYLTGVKIELSGGCELLFPGKPTCITVPAPSGAGEIDVRCLRKGATLNALVLHLRDRFILPAAAASAGAPFHAMKAAQQFCVEDASTGTGSGANGFVLRPGILALVNDCDAEVFGGAAYVLEDNDVVAFISTLHGG